MLEMYTFRHLKRDIFTGVSGYTLTHTHQNGNHLIGNKKSKWKLIYSQDYLPLDVLNEQTWPHQHMQTDGQTDLHWHIDLNSNARHVRPHKSDSNVHLMAIILIDPFTVLSNIAISQICSFLFELSAASTLDLIELLKRD